MILDALKEEISQLRSRYSLVSAIFVTLFGWLIHNAKIFSTSEIIVGGSSMIALYFVITSIDKDVALMISQIRLLKNKKL